MAEELAPDAKELTPIVIAPVAVAMDQAPKAIEARPLAFASVPKAPE